MRLALVPRTTEFYDLFTAAGENALEAARLVERASATFPSARCARHEVKELEHKGDELTREIIELLNTQYITPFDREDIYELATAIDDVVDHIENASDLLDLYKRRVARRGSPRAVPRSSSAAAEHLSTAPRPSCKRLRGVRARTSSSSRRSRTRATASSATRSPPSSANHGSTR